MSAILTTNLRVKNSATMADLFKNSSQNHYLFISKPTPWTDDNYPDNPVDSPTFERSVRDELISLRKINSSDVSQSIFRIDWKSGKFYDMYRNDYDGLKNNGVDLDTGSFVAKAGLTGASFYVVTDEYNVYKCLFNNNRSASTIKPTGTSTNPLTTSDGYVWKYMFTVSSGDAIKFASTNFIPVSNIGINPGVSSPYYNQFLVENSAIAGQIDIVSIEDGGNGYAANSTLPLSFLGDGTGAAGTVSTNANGKVVSIAITNPGSGYTYCSVSVVGSSVSTANLLAIIPPLGGHGKNSVYELGGYFTTISSVIGDDVTDDTPTSNEYRVIGIISNPTRYNSTSLFTDQTGSALKYIQIAAGITGALVNDEQLNSIGNVSNRGSVVSYSSATKNIKYIRNKQNIGADFQVSQTVIGATSGATGIITALGDPEVDINSGEIIYLETRRPIYRSVSQKEEIKVTIEF